MELSAADMEPEEKELDDDELGAVVGGSICACAMGGGKKDDRDKICACMIAGVGETNTPYGRCLCFGGGYGD